MNSSENKKIAEEFLNDLRLSDSARNLREARVWVGKGEVRIYLNSARYSYARDTGSRLKHKSNSYWKVEDGKVQCTQKWREVAAQGASRREELIALLEKGIDEELFQRQIEKLEDPEMIEMIQEFQETKLRELNGAYFDLKTTGTDVSKYEKYCTYISKGN